MKTSTAIVVRRFVLGCVLVLAACSEDAGVANTSGSGESSAGESGTTSGDSSGSTSSSGSASSTSTESDSSATSQSGSSSGAVDSSGTGDTDVGCVLVLDDFERAELRPDWTVHNGTPHIVGGSDFGGDPGLNIATWTAEPVPDDQYAEGVLSDSLDTTNSMIFVRRRNRDLQRYGYVWVGSSYADCKALDPSWGSGPGGMILKLDGGPNAPALACTQRAMVVGGDVLRVEVQGNTLRGYVNGEPFGEATDDTLTSGEPGIAMAPPEANQVGFESFEVGCVR